MFKEVLDHSRSLPWKIGNKVLPCKTPLIMGIVNVTPDSFFDGGKHNKPDAAYEHALMLLEQGAEILDIGGESSRPGSAPVSLQEELDRVCPVVERLAELAKSGYSSGGKPREFYISVDTVKAKVAAETMKLGAHIINDISACAMDPNMLQTVADTKAAVVLNHIRGNFGTMQQDFKPYTNVVQEVREELLSQVKKLLDLGVEREKICIDPGIGFGKTAQDNIDLMKSTEEFLKDGYPVLIGTSRKSYIGKMPGLETSDRLIPTVTAGIVAVLGGASCIRVHDVKEAKESLLYLEALRT
ncbi:MAG: dihydropteroate synthase [Fibrobacter sp.]|jgi:dihydropteroate synthase|uniref:dihydropteroate synthase n=1 Tax=Fibrobacter sp. TaxID=35828 RepID=UPI002A90D8E5|nr:dihydropteroate synthase [Fibrobacter sp.]MDY6264248.1 dihydropteroate synthase [Fibrobacter sp.]